MIARSNISSCYLNVIPSQANIQDFVSRLIIFYTFLWVKQLDIMCHLVHRKNLTPPYKVHIVIWEPEGHYHYSAMFCWEPEGCYCSTQSMAIAPFLVLSRQYIYAFLVWCWSGQFECHTSYWDIGQIQTLTARLNVL